MENINFLKDPTTHWVFKKHTNSIGLLIDVALYLKQHNSNVSVSDKQQMYIDFSKTNLYNPRESKRESPTDAINHRIDGLRFYMFGYSDKIDGVDKFIFSPLGNLFLSNLSNTNYLTKIFITMLVGIQFPHPGSRTSYALKLYPFRLIFKLLLDKRLHHKLYNYEVYEFLINMQSINEDSYEALVSTLLESRKEPFSSKFCRLKYKEHEIVKSVYEWQYYVLSLLESINIFNHNKGDAFVELYHPQKPNSKSLATKRKANNGYFSLNKDVIDFVKNLISKYSPFDDPLDLSLTNRLSDDIVKEIYSFYPDELLEELGIGKDNIEAEILSLPKYIEAYSLNPNNETAELFEEVLETTFNLFANVEARRISGPGNTDIECLQFDIKEKFAVEAKSTSKKLVNINAGRLHRHRSLINAQYTIVVTPRYVPSVKYDIKGEAIVIIKANTLSEYIYNYLISNIDELDYTELRDIIINNLGSDISLQLSEITLSKFG